MQPPTLLPFQQMNVVNGARYRGLTTALALSGHDGTCVETDRNKLAALQKCLDGRNTLEQHIMLRRSYEYLGVGRGDSTAQDSAVLVGARRVRSLPTDPIPTSAPAAGPAHRLQP
ncbi:hypothetical protein GCM10008955_08200 [Deinococcus malanensis]|uniref:Uncharacterized protein n=1 Tax=Deinococcus malanensis TaxID=1706855 RepID=A0ABQ2EMN3_9DEIO|nr:hypothetical protein [Deinococcus malanensis]GGK17084.1 hypothetical protein GCM10008955_08200 [Deinococcus malanensis]